MFLYILMFRVSRDTPTKSRSCVCIVCHKNWNFELTEQVYIALRVE